MRKFGPLTADHPAVGQICPGCHQPLAEGDEPTIVIVGPGDDPDARQRRDEGRAYNAIGTIAHWECSSQEPDA